MPCIRRHYNYGLIYLNPAPIRSKALAGQTVDVRTLTDDFKRVSFAGFLDRSALPERHKLVKIINVSAYSESTSEIGDFIDYGRNVTMLGAYISGEIWLILEAASPIVWCEVG